MSTYCSVDLDISLWYGWVRVPSHENQMSVLNDSYDSGSGNANCLTCGHLIHKVFLVVYEHLGNW